MAFIYLNVCFVIYRAEASQAGGLLLRDNSLTRIQVSVKLFKKPRNFIIELFLTYVNIFALTEQRRNTFRKIR